jgi:hypothetical protein
VDVFFIVYDLIWLFVTFVELLWLVDAFFIVYVCLVFVLAYRTLSRYESASPLGHVWVRKCWSLKSMCVGC